VVGEWVGVQEGGMQDFADVDVDAEADSDSGSGSDSDSDSDSGLWRLAASAVCRPGIYNISATQTSPQQKHSWEVVAGRYTTPHHTTVPLPYQNLPAKRAYAEPSGRDTHHETLGLELRIPALVLHLCLFVCVCMSVYLYCSSRGHDHASRACACALTLPLLSSPRPVVDVTHYLTIPATRLLLRHPLLHHCGESR
jgi:hypothetical protein